ncbi:MAG: F0F1 ATP synthase subunit epsilon [Candidatus Pacebacteria bacterium]|nr:F0F1 ATP synthase subunit epsilon [Candidatus Paceibacterota bacterium]
MKIEILTPEKIMFQGEADSVNLPTPAGYITILPNHASLISAVSDGKITVKSGTGESKFFTQGGAVEVAADKVTMLLRVPKTD